MPWAGTSHAPQAFLDNLREMFTRWESQAFNVSTISPLSILVKVADGKVTYLQFLEDSYATAASFRRDDTWAVQTSAEAELLEVGDQDFTQVTEEALQP
jgi:hypothetical protein